MLSFFRSNQAYAGLLLFLYALVLWLPFYLAGAPAVADAGGNGVLGQWLLDMLKDQPLLAFLTAVLLVGIQGIQANTWTTRYRLSRAVTQFPGLFLVLTASMVAGTHALHAFLIANVLLLFALLSLSRLYKRDEPAVALFNAGAWLGIASLFRPEYLLFVPAAIITISILRRPDLRSIFQLLTGLMVVYFFLAVTGYLTGNFGEWFAQQFGHFGWPEITPVGWYNLLGLLVLGVILLAVILFFGRIGVMLNIEGKKNMSVLAWLLLLSGLVLVSSGSIGPVNSQVVVVPLGILFGLGLIDVQPARAEALHIILVAAVLIPLLLGA